MTSNYDENSRGSFIRKGKVGEWRELFSPQRIEDWRKWIAEETKGTDLKFDLSEEAEDKPATKKNSTNLFKDRPQFLQA